MNIILYILILSTDITNSNTYLLLENSILFLGLIAMKSLFFIRQSFLDRNILDLKLIPMSNRRLVNEIIGE